jgi:GntR family transcriptional regulator / MocR family aminotransferase
VAHKTPSEDTAIARAAARGVGVYGISPFFLTPSLRAGLVLGYSRMNEKEIREGIRLLSEAF